MSDAFTQLEERVRPLECEPSDVVAQAERVRTEARLGAGAQAAECARFEQEEKRWAQVTDGIKSERMWWEQSREELSTKTEDQWRRMACALVQCFDVPLFSRESGPGILIDATSAP